MADESVFEGLSGTQKSAILMMLLGEDEASEILKNLSPKEVQHLGTAMYSVQGIDQDTVNKVLDEAGKITGVIAANLGGNIVAISKAISVAKQFGMELQQVFGQC